MQLVNRPDAWCGKLDEVIIWIAEVQACAAAGPTDRALDSDFLFGEPRFPIRQFRRRNRKGDVQRSAAVVRPHRSKRQLGCAIRRAALEEQQDTPSADAIRANAGVSLYYPAEAEKIFVET